MLLDMRPGTFITIEGVDRLANSAQIEMLSERLKNRGLEVLVFNFSELREPSGHLVKQYLEGKFGSVNDVGPYTSSLFFSMNRYQAASDIRAALDDGKVVIATEFSGASMAQQGVNFQSPEERRGFFVWLDNLEFQMLKLPRPDKSFVLRMPADSLSGNFGKLASTYDDLCQLFPNDFLRVDYVRSGKSMTSKQINDYIWRLIESLLPKTIIKKSKHVTNVPPSAVFIPDSLKGAIRETYTDILGQILELRRQIGKQLRNKEVEQGKQVEILESLLPVAAYRSPAEQLTAQELVKFSAFEHEIIDRLSETYSEDAAELSVLNVAPRNELDVLSQILYKSSGLRLNELKEHINKWSYEQKTTVYETLLKTNNETLDSLSYSVELVTSILNMNELTSIVRNKPVHQSFSPRYGFEVPSVVDNDEMLDNYEEAFQLSLKLFSKLQAAGLENEAQLAVLRGHKVRCLLNLTASDLKDLTKPLKTPGTYPALSELITKLVEQLSNSHPLANEFIKK